MVRRNEGVKEGEGKGENWPFPELDGDCFEEAVRTGDYCPEDIKDDLEPTSEVMMDEDWAFPELDGDFFEVAVRTGDYCPEDINDNPRDHERQFPEDCGDDDDDDDDDDDIMMEEYEMQGDGGGDDDDDSSGELWVLKKRQEKHIENMT